MPACRPRRVAVDAGSSTLLNGGRATIVRARMGTIVLRGDVMVEHPLGPALEFLAGYDHGGDAEPPRILIADEPW
jgi:hypothetical protein